jgi:hypothetical protein
MWPEMTMRRTDGGARTLIVLSSISVPVPPRIHPLLQAYEERYLFYVLLLANSPQARVVYVTSQPVLPRLLDYYLNLLPGLDAADARGRLTVVSVGDPTPRPLTQKILARPRLVQRLRSLVPDPARALLLPFVTTPLEAELAVRLGVPVYGSDPDLGWLGTKSGSREVFAAAGVEHPAGATRLSCLGDVVDAVRVVRETAGARQVMVNLDNAVSGFGNAVVTLDRSTDRRSVERAVRRMQLEDPELDVDRFLARVETERAIVEERICGDQLPSPSAQLRASPLGEVELLSTHDQILGGPSGQTFEGCRFPADRRYATALREPALAIGRELAARGVIGRFSVDFVVTRSDRGWRPLALEVNLRNGGTTHPMNTLAALTDGSYDARSGRLDSPAGHRCYVATDHLGGSGYASLTPDDVLDVVAEKGLQWDHRTHSGVVFHMVSAIAVGGHVGLTAIDRTPAMAARMFRRAKQALDAATADEDRTVIDLTLPGPRKQLPRVRLSTGAAAASGDAVVSWPRRPAT